MSQDKELPPYSAGEMMTYPPPAVGPEQVHPTQQPGYGYGPNAHAQPSYVSGPPAQPGYGAPAQPGYGAPAHQGYAAPQPAHNTVQNTNVVVVTGGAQTGPVGPRGWSTDLCACCSDCESCCFEWWCSCCHSCSIAARLGEPSCLVGCCCYACFSPSHMRTKLRTMHNITVNGNICCDICMFLYCKPCMMCQMARELKHIGL